MKIIQKIRLIEECIIYNGTLYHSKYKIYVKPDLIIYVVYFEIFSEVKMIYEYIIIIFFLKFFILIQIKQIY